MAARRKEKIAEVEGTSFFGLLLWGRARKDKEGKHSEKRQKRCSLLKESLKKEPGGEKTAWEDKGTAVEERGNLEATE